MPLKSAMSARFRMIAASSTVLPPDQGSAVPSCARSRAISSSTATPGPSRPSASGASCRRTATTGVRFRPCVSWVAASRGGRARTRPGAWRATSTTSLPRDAPRRTVRTSIARGQLLAVHLDFDSTGFTVVDHRDVPGRNAVAAHPERPAVPRRTRDPPRRGAGAAPRARGPRGARGRALRLECRADEPLLDPRAPRRHVFKGSRSRRGTSRAASPRPRRRRGRLRDGRQEHVYIEPQGMIAVPGDGAPTSTARSSAPTTCRRRSWPLSACPRRRCASCRPTRAAASAARRSTRRSSPSTRPCSR